MTIDEAVKKINEAAPGEALAVAQEVIALLSEDDRLMAGGDLEEMAIIIDES